MLDIPKLPVVSNSLLAIYFINSCCTQKVPVISNTLHVKFFFQFLLYTEYICYNTIIYIVYDIILEIYTIKVPNWN